MRQGCAGMYNKAMPNRRTTRTKTILVSIIIVLAAAGIAAGVIAFSRRADAPQAAKPAHAAATKPSAPAPSSTAPATFDKTTYSTTDASSPWVIVNKQHALNPIDYAPGDLVTLYGHQVSGRMSTDLQDMVGDAAKDGANLTIASSYRSYQYQVGLYNSYVAQDGQAGADEYSARPGYSEHQTGLAIDFGDKAGTCIVEDCYSGTPEGKWLLANAYKYGFLLRYTTADQPVTGYENEPWHYRYVGRDLTNEMHNENVATLEEFFNVTGGTNY